MKSLVAVATARDFVAPLDHVVGEPVERDRQGADAAVTTPGYFHTLDLAIVAGRGFTAHDTLKTAPVCVVDGVQPLDTETFGLVGVLVALTAMIATAVPALRALQLDPVATLRSE